MRKANASYEQVSIATGWQWGERGRQARADRGFVCDSRLIAQTYDQTIDPKAERALLWKIDLLLMPILTISLGVSSHLERTRSWAMRVATPSTDPEFFRNRSNTGTRLYSVAPPSSESSRISACRRRTLLESSAPCDTLLPRLPSTGATSSP